MPTILSRLEVLAEQTNVVYVDLFNDSEQISIASSKHESGLVRERLADLVALRTALLDDVVGNNAVDWFRSISSRQVWPTSATLTVRFALSRTRRGARLASPEQALVSFAETVAGSVFRQSQAKRWTWRHSILRAGQDMHLELRREVDGAPVLPLGPQPERRPTAAILTPIASFGGAEKVAYAAARALKEAGYETHVFVLGSSSMAVLDTFDRHFDFVHIWDDRLPQWGSDRRFIGHDFLDDNPDVDWKLLKGQLSGFDLVVNNHVMAAHPLMGRLRAEGTRTACYLHVVDHTPLGRPAGQPYAGIAFEHAYDVFITCSDVLKRYLMGFGVAGGKIFAVVNGPGFSLDPAALTTLRAERGRPRPGPLRLLYIGRLDVQKGIDRLHSVLQRLAEAGVPYTARIVGGELIKDGQDNWASRLAKYAEVLPPVFSANDVVKHLHWSDATLLPSRWEGRPWWCGRRSMSARFR
ncbi:glycosyltransferase family 4 protein [Siccirubricoccus deserti]